MFVWAPVFMKENNCADELITDASIIYHKSNISRPFHLLQKLQCLMGNVSQLLDIREELWGVDGVWEEELGLQPEAHPQSKEVQLWPLPA